MPSPAQGPHPGAAPPPKATALAAAPAHPPQPVVFHSKKGAGGSSSPVRFGFYHNGILAYEWEQKLEEVVIYVRAPPNADIEVKILPAQLRIGIRGSPTYFLDEGTGGKVDLSESTWTKEEDDDAGGAVLLVVYLQKANRGVVWEQALTRFDCPLDPMQLEEVRQDLLRERWTRENPGIDFSSAAFNGQAPDPRTFMGGCRYDN